jgi:hypothetical protein
MLRTNTCSYGRMSAASSRFGVDGDAADVVEVGVRDQWRGGSCSSSWCGCVAARRPSGSVVGSGALSISRTGPTPGGDGQEGIALEGGEGLEGVAVDDRGVVEVAAGLGPDDRPRAAASRRAQSALALDREGLGGPQRPAERGRGGLGRRARGRRCGCSWRGRRPPARWPRPRGRCRRDGGRSSAGARRPPAGRPSDRTPPRPGAPSAGAWRPPSRRHPKCSGRGRALQPGARPVHGDRRAEALRVDPHRGPARTPGPRRRPPRARGRGPRRADTARGPRSARTGWGSRTG